MKEINLSNLIREKLGVTSTKVFNPEFPDIPSPGGAFRRNERGKAAGTPLYKPLPNGQEMYLPVWFKYTESSPLDTGDGATVDIEKKFLLPYAVVSIRSQTISVNTVLTNRRGTVKEIINTGDYEIAIRGVCIGRRNELPEDDIATLKTIKNLGKPIKMICALTDIFLMDPERVGSDDVVVNSLNFTEMRGSKNAIYYDMQLASDAPFNLLDIS